MKTISTKFHPCISAPSARYRLRGVVIAEGLLVLFPPMVPIKNGVGKGSIRRARKKAAHKAHQKAFDGPAESPFPFFLPSLPFGFGGLRDHWSRPQYDRFNVSQMPLKGVEA